MNSNGDAVFGVAGSNSSATLRYQLAKPTSDGTYLTGTYTNFSPSTGNVRANWFQVEMLLNLTGSKKEVVKIKTTVGTTVQTYGPISLTNGGEISKFHAITGKYNAIGLDNLSVANLLADNISNLTGNAEVQTLSSRVDVTYSVTTLASVSSLSVSNIEVPGGNSNINWSISDYGTLSEQDQSLISINRNDSNHAQAFLTTTGAVSADAIITVSAVYGSTTLTKQITLKAADLEGAKADLFTEIGAATTIRDNVSASNPYIAGIKSTLTTAISTTNDVYTNSTSVSEVSTAKITLQTAETAFTNAMTPYNNFVTYIGAVTSGRDAEVRTAPFFTAIKATLTTAIDAANTATGTVTSTDDISSAQSTLQAAYTQFGTDKVAYDNLNNQITLVSSRLSAVNIRKGDTKVLMFPTATVQTLTDAKTAAEYTRDNATTPSEMSTAQTTVTTALATFNSSGRVGPGSSYYRIYTNGADGGDGTQTRSILFAEGTTLNYKTNSSTLDANSIWKITEISTDRYTLQNVGTGNYLNGNTLSASPTTFTFPENKSQSGYVTWMTDYDSSTKLGTIPDAYFLYSIVNSTPRVLEVDTWTAPIGVFVLYNGSAPERYRYCFQFEPINTLPVSTSGNMSSATNWSFGNAPVSEDFAVAGSLVVDQDAIGLSNVNVVAGGAISVDAGKKLTLSSALVNNGVLTLKSDDINGTATVITNGAVSGTGTTNVEQYLSGDGRQWWYLASPVSAASSSIFGSDKVGKHVEDYLNDGNTATNEPYYTSPFTEAEILTAGRGYVVKRAATTAATYNFTGGSLNTGDITLAPTRTGTTAGARGFNLVGNPYPSYIDWDLVYANAINMRNAIWFRTFSGGNMAFHTYGDGDGVPADLATGKIAPMQAFWVKVDLDNTGATLTFKNTHRKHFETGLSNPLKVKALDTRPHLRLVVSNGTATDETLIVGKSYASNELDSYDIEKMTNNNVAIPEIYSVVSNHDLVINSMNELSEGKFVPLGFRPGQTGNFTITATQLENIDTKVMLLDKQAVKEQELTAESPYSFIVTDAAPTNDRFVISFVSRVPTGVEINGKAGDLMVYSNINNRIQLIYRGELTERTAVSVYNVAGQMLSTQKLVKATNELSGTFNPGVYMIRVNDGNQSITKKLIIR